jgi:VanZ family protein
MKVYQKFSLFSALITAIIIFYISSLKFASSTRIFSWESVAYHFFIFFFISFFLCFSVKFDRKELFFAILVSIIYAGLDELHQYFVPGRFCDIFDFFTNLSGILFGFVFYLILLSIACKLSNYKSN